MLEGLRQRLDGVGQPFRRLLASDALMLLALMIGKVAVPWWIAQRGGALHLAWYGITGAVAGMVSMVAFSPLGDRYPKGLLISLSLVAMAIESAVLVAMSSTGQYHIGPILALEAVADIAMAVIAPASLSIVAELVSAERLPDALSLQKSAQAAGRMVGPLLGGSMLAAIGVTGALWLHCLMLLCAALMAWRIPRTAPALRQSGWWRELKQGVAAKWHIPLERGWTLVNFMVSICFMPAVAMLLPLKVQSLGLSGVWLGVCEAALSVGLLFGALGGAGWVAARLGRYGARMGCLVAQGFLLAMIGLAGWPALLALAFFSIGICLSVVQLVGQTHRMLAIPVAFRARMTAVNLMTIHVANTLGPALAGISLAHLHVGGVYVLFGLAMVACSVGYLFVPDYRRFLSLDHESVKDWYGREYPHIFAEPAPASPVQAC